MIQSERIRIWRERKVAKGLCGSCGLHPIAFKFSISRCTYCLRHNAIGQELYRERKKKNERSFYGYPQKNAGNS